MSEGKSIFDNFKASSSTPEEIISEMNTADENLPMKTDIRNPVAMSVADVFAKFIKEEGEEFKAVGEMYEDLLLWIRKNFVSETRKSRNETFETLKSYMAQKAQADSIDAVFKR